MKRIKTLLCLLLPLTVLAQTYTPVTGNWSVKKILRNGITNFNLTDSLAFNGNRPITLPQLAGVNPGTATTMQDFLNALFYPSQPPTAGLTGGNQQELRAAGSTSATLNWSAGRQASTALLTTVVVGSVPQTFTQPAAPGSISGTQSVTVTYNSTNTFTNVVTTADGKTASASTSFTFSPRGYRGFINDTTTIKNLNTDDGIIQALQFGFVSSRAMSQTTVVPSDQYYMYAYPASFGALTSLTINGFPSLASMSSVTRNFTNVMGYTQSYRIYWTKNRQTSAIPIIAN